MGKLDNVTVDVPGDHHWIFKFFSNGTLVLTRYVTLRADGRVHEAKATRMPNGKKVVKEEYMAKAN
jgi:hypothetical protein